MTLDLARQVIQSLVRGRRQDVTKDSNRILVRLAFVDQQPDHGSGVDDRLGFGGHSVSLFLVEIFEQVGYQSLFYDRTAVLVAGKALQGFRRSGQPPLRPVV